MFRTAKRIRSSRFPRGGCSASLFRQGFDRCIGRTKEKIRAAGIQLETAPISRLVARGSELEAIELQAGARVACDFLFTHPPQQHVDVVRELHLALDDAGFVQVDPMRLETSVPGIYAAGDLTTRMQGAIHAAAAANRAASIINMELTTELAVSGAL